MLSCPTATVNECSLRQPHTEFYSAPYFFHQPTIDESSSKKTSDDDDIDFEAMFNLPKRGEAAETASPYDSPKDSSNETSSKPKDKNKLSRYD